MSILYIIIGLVAIGWGADRFTDGAGALARRFRVPEIIIGLTIVGFGTSLPEFCVSFVAALEGSADIALGNVVGSNIFNALLIVGLAALVAPIRVEHSTVMGDLPFSVMACAMLAAMSFDGHVSRLDALLLVCVFAVYMLRALRMARTKHIEVEDASAAPVRSLVWCLAWLVVGMGCLVVGSRLFVYGATDIARSLGVSEAIVGLTIAAAGTSLPELATSVTAARKGQAGIALGNVIGSCVFNVFFVIGVTGLVAPMSAAGITTLDLVTMMCSMLLVWGLSFTKHEVSRWEGALLTLLFLGYMTWLVLHELGVA
ncbi:MAG: calcium/sodium antiporter [Alloprevotella sp.]|nr:calcium/sodium antiporter [Alloprevotella sp.]MBR1594931.1 calcium/sodium antiporter [Alloprevotella sp.]